MRADSRRCAAGIVAALLLTGWCFGGPPPQYPEFPPQYPTINRVKPAVVVPDIDFNLKSLNQPVAEVPAVPFASPTAAPYAEPSSSSRQAPAPSPAPTFIVAPTTVQRGFTTTSSGNCGTLG